MKISFRYPEWMFSLKAACAKNNAAVIFLMNSSNFIGTSGTRDLLDFASNSSNTGSKHPYCAISAADELVKICVIRIWYSFFSFEFVLVVCDLEYLLKQDAYSPSFFGGY